MKYTFSSNLHQKLFENNVMQMLENLVIVSQTKNNLYSSRYYT